MFSQIFFVSSSTFFFQVFFDCLCFLLPLNLRYRGTPKTLSSSPLGKNSCHLALFAFASFSKTSFNLSMSICSSVVFFSFTFRSYMAPPIAFFILFKIAFSFSLKHRVSLSYNIAIADLTQQQQILLSSKETYFQVTTLHIP